MDKLKIGQIEPYGIIFIIIIIIIVIIIINIIIIRIGANDKLKIEPPGIMRKFGQRAGPQGSASFTR